MRLLGKKIILKIKNRGNKKLCHEIDRLISDIEAFDVTIKNISELRHDADCVYNDGFYFFNIQLHRILIRIEIDDFGEATLIWAGSHQAYEMIFKNNKKTIEKWLRNKVYIL